MNTSQDRTVQNTVKSWTCRPYVIFPGQNSPVKIPGENSGWKFPGWKFRVKIPTVKNTCIRVKSPRVKNRHLRVKSPRVKNTGWKFSGWKFSGWKFPGWKFWVKIPRVKIQGENSQGVKYGVKIPRHLRVKILGENSGWTFLQWKIHVSGSKVPGWKIDISGWKIHVARSRVLFRSEPGKKTLKSLTSSHMNTSQDRTVQNTVKSWTCRPYVIFPGQNSPGRRNHRPEQLARVGGHRRQPVLNPAMHKASDAGHIEPHGMRRCLSFSYRGRRHQPPTRPRRQKNGSFLKSARCA